MVGANHGGGYLVSAGHHPTLSDFQACIPALVLCRTHQLQVDCLGFSPEFHRESHTALILSQYSLCPAGEALTERCFHNLTLPFVGSTHTIRYLDNGTEFTIPAVDVNEGTWPQGSAWRLNPIPAW